MKPLIGVIVAVSVCLVYPPWRPTAKWKETRTGWEATPEYVRSLDRRFFGYLPNSYGWLWRPPKFKSKMDGIYREDLGPTRTTVFEMKTQEVSTRIDLRFLLIQGTFFALAAIAATAGVSQLSLRRRDLLKALVAGSMFYVSAIFAFAGFRVNLIRIQSTFFSISGAAFIWFLLGATGIATSIFLLRFPKPAGIFAIVVTLTLAGMDIYLLNLHSRPVNVMQSRVLVVCVLLLLALAVYKLFCRDHKRSDILGG